MLPKYQSDAKRLSERMETGFVQLAAPALDLAGMDADPPADGREGIALADDLHRLFVIPAGDGGHVVGHVDPGRAGVLAGRDHHAFAGGARAALLPGCGPRIPRLKYLQGGQGRLGAGLPQTAEGRLGDRFAQIADRLEVPDVPRGPG